MATSKTSGPASVAEGLGNVLSAITDTMKAPDATQFAVKLMQLQTNVLDLIHGGMNKPQGGATGAAPGGGQPPGGPPAPGGAPPAGGPGQALMGGIAGMQGAGQGPSPAVGNKGGIDPDMLRQMAAVGADDDS